MKTEIVWQRRVWNTKSTTWKLQLTRKKSMRKNCLKLRKTRTSQKPKRWMLTNSTVMLRLMKIQMPLLESRIVSMHNLRRTMKKTCQTRRLQSSASGDWMKVAFSDALIPSTFPVPWSAKWSMSMELNSNKFYTKIIKTSSSSTIKRLTMKPIKYTSAF